MASGGMFSSRICGAQDKISVPSSNANCSSYSRASEFFSTSTTVSLATETNQPSKCSTQPPCLSPCLAFWYHRHILNLLRFLARAVGDVSLLEEYVSNSQSVLLFLSKGYFFSRRCNRELYAATALKKPLCLVHEADVNHGGSSLVSFRDDCPESIRSLVFQDEHGGIECREREVISWLHTSAFQLVSMRMIAKTVLSSTPLYKDATPQVYIGGELGFKELTFQRPVVLYASAANLGAAEVATEILNRFDDANVNITLRRPPVLKGSRASQSIDDVASPSIPACASLGVSGQMEHTANHFCESGPTSTMRNSRRSSDPSLFGELREESISEYSEETGELRRTSTELVRSLNALEPVVHGGITEGSRSTSSRPEEMRRSSSGLVSALKARAPRFGDATSWAVDTVESIRQRLKGSPGEATHMLLYLNSRTFEHELGSRFAREVRAARRANLPIVIIHENDVTFGGADFETYARLTLAHITLAYHVCACIKLIKHHLCSSGS